MNIKNNVNITRSNIMTDDNIASNLFFLMILIISNIIDTTNIINKLVVKVIYTLLIPFIL